MSRLTPKASSEFVRLSYWAFAGWWTIILSVHIVTSVYNALYAYSYWKLQDSFLNLYLDSFQIGMPPPYHHRIAVVHSIMSAVHGVCIFLMVGGSIWRRSLAFTPWSSCNVGEKTDEVKKDRTSSVVLQSFLKVYSKISDRRGICGVNSDYFHPVLICREVVETALQTVQAYRMSVLLPRTLLNRFYVLLLTINCWSSVAAYSILFKGDEARRRFTCIVLDCVLDLVACMGVELMILLSYAKDYDPKLQGFSEVLWYNDEWVARALNEFRMVVVVSWSDLVSRSIFSLGLVMTTMSMKELLQRLPRNANRVGQLSAPNASDIIATSPQFWRDKLNSVGPKMPAPTSPSPHLNKHLLGFHIHAAVQPTLSQCLMQVRPWTATRPSCYLAGLDCHALAIQGTIDEVGVNWSEFDASTVVQLLIRHCPALEVPDIFGEFSGLRGIKIYNTTIKAWGESAAITKTNHPGMSSLFIVRVNMTGGLLPPGLQSPDFPPSLYDIEICVTNLRALPDDLDTKWPPDAIIQVEYSQLTTVPLVLARLQPYYLAVTGNPITELPPEVFEVQGILFLGISDMNIRELPRNVTNLSAALSWIFIGETNISFFWAWVDELVIRMKGRANPWLAGPTPYCDNLEKILNGTATAFSVPLSPEYSQTMMDPSEANRPVLVKSVRCDPTIEGLFKIEDGINAISTSPPLVRPRYNGSQQ
ncbi:unnamed protein product [Phytophthora lilii]|uniref:Unnamed protein product n=1 Tax=Phytophthora lilii TaxID=2077276 RepID=A0A9W6TWG9_9STRA|nr:unnamed protein product [Phytophthora lilii]